jgi:hypothetical protein
MTPPKPFTHVESISNTYISLLVSTEKKLHPSIHIESVDMYLPKNHFQERN